MQLSIMTIKGYGPWTLTLGSDREHELQMLQARMYARVQKLFSDAGGLVFLNRADELFALSTGLGLDAHADIQDALMSEFDLRLRIAIGAGDTPAAADLAARDSAAADPVDGPRMMFGDARGDDGNDSSSVGDSIVMHMDVDGLSSRSSSPYETSLLMLGIYQKMSAYFYRNYESLAFFMGGDNFMIISSEQAAAEGAGRFVDEILRQDGIQLNCGIGRAARGRQAASRATESLDMIRKIRDDSGGAPPRVYEHSRT